MSYGGKEDVLFYWFQKAWECEPLLPILGRGTNVVPLINVMDLAQLVYIIQIQFMFGIVTAKRDNKISNNVKSTWDI